MNCPECGQITGFKCAACGRHCPKHWYYYKALNQQTREVASPICGRCMQNPSDKFLPPAWKIEGPIKQVEQV